MGVEGRSASPSLPTLLPPDHSDLNLTSALTLIHLDLLRPLTATLAFLPPNASQSQRQSDSSSLSSVQSSSTSPARPLIHQAGLGILLSITSTSPYPRFTTRRDREAFVSCFLSVSSFARASSYLALPSSASLPPSRSAGPLSCSDAESASGT